MPPSIPTTPQSRFPRRWLLVLTAAVVLLILVVALMSLFAVVPGDPEPVDEATDMEVRAYEPAEPAAP